MNEAKNWPVPVCNMWVLPKTDNLEYIPVSSDPARRVHVSDMPETVSVVQNVHNRIEQQASLMDLMEKIGTVVGGMACGGMIYLVIRIGMGWAW